MSVTAPNQQSAGAPVMEPASKESAATSTMKELSCAFASNHRPVFNNVGKDNKGATWLVMNNAPIPCVPSEFGSDQQRVIGYLLLDPI